MKACLLLKRIEVVLMTSLFTVKARLLTTKQFMGLHGEKLSKFFEQEFTIVKTEAEFLSQTLQESPWKHKLRTQLENSKEETRELQKNLTPA